MIFNPTDLGLLDIGSWHFWIGVCMTLLFTTMLCLIVAMPFMLRDVLLEMNRHIQRETKEAPEDLGRFIRHDKIVIYERQVNDGFYDYSLLPNSRSFYSGHKFGSESEQGEIAKEWLGVEPKQVKVIPIKE